MNIIGLILARAGSKRVPQKNTKILQDKPLISWTIDTALAAPSINELFLSTDCEESALIAKNSGIHVPWMRPAHLATDTAKSVDVILHALNWFEQEKKKIDGLLILQPTSPFITIDSIEKGIDLFKKSNKQTVIGVSPAPAFPEWLFYVNNNNHLEPCLPQDNINQRSQDLKPSYYINGSFYLIEPELLKKEKSFFTKQMIPLMIPALNEALDIDSQEDWDLAENFLLNKLREI
jgi:N-acylneuraminate cytidylyltransferase